LTCPLTIPAPLQSGGIGPTHDDITYPSIAKAFGLPLTLHGPTAKRMRRLSKTEADFDWDADTPQREAKWRMARLPLVAADSKNEGQGEEAAAVDDGEDDDDARVIFPYEDLWVPVVVVNENVHILPGVPQLFEKLLNGILPTLLPRIAHRDAHQHRVLVTTPRSESRIAAYLAQLAARVAALGVKVGSYPVWIDAFQAEHNTVSLVGRDRAVLDGLAKEVVREVDGVLVEEAGDKGAAGGGEEAAK
jgi:molybdopterin-biosynthesis enzyme MoeA-like protein